MYEYEQYTSPKITQPHHNRCLMQDKKLLLTLFHLFGFMHFAYGCYYEYAYITGPYYQNSLRGKLKYLSYWNALGLTIYFLLCIFHDVSADRCTAARVAHYKDLLFTCILFPLSIFISLTFWGIYVINQRLVLPAFLERCYPYWLLHLMHTNIIFFCIVELVTSYRKYTNRAHGFTWLLCFIGFYYIWIHTYYLCSDSWTHPILRCMNSPKRFLFYLLCLGILMGGYWVGEYLNTMIWGKGPCEVECCSVGMVRVDRTLDDFIPTETRPLKPAEKVQIEKPKPDKKIEVENPRPVLQVPKPRPVLEVPKPRPASEVPKPHPASEVPKPHPASEVSKPRPVSEVPKPRPVSEVPKTRPVSEVPKPRPVSEAPKPHPVSEVPKPHPASEVSEPHPVSEVPKPHPVSEVPEPHAVLPESNPPPQAQEPASLEQQCINARWLKRQKEWKRESIYF